MQVIVLVLWVVTITVRFIWGFNEWMWGHLGMHWATDHYFFINYLLIYSNKIYTILLLKYFPGQLINFQWHLQMPHQLITGCVLNNTHCRCTIRFWTSLTYSCISTDKPKENIGNFWKIILMTSNTIMFLKDKARWIHNQTWLWKWVVTAAGGCLLWVFSFPSFQ